MFSTSSLLTSQKKPTKDASSKGSSSMEKNSSSKIGWDEVNFLLTSAGGKTLITPPSGADDGAEAERSRA